MGVSPVIMNTLRVLTFVVSVTLGACAAAPPAKVPEAQLDQARITSPEPATPEISKAPPSPAAPAKPLAVAVITPKAELKKGLAKQDLEGASKGLKIGASWDETTKALVSKLGKPSYTLSPGRNLVEEDWWWVVSAGNSCVTWSIGRRGTKLDQYGMVGTYGPNVTEEIRSGDGFLEPCTGGVTATAK